jgi:hypothetical protein
LQRKKYGTLVTASHILTKQKNEKWQHKSDVPVAIIIISSNSRSSQQLGLCQWKKSSDTIGNRNRDLPVCSAVPQPLRHRVPVCFSLGGKSLSRFACYTLSVDLRFTVFCWVNPLAPSDLYMGRTAPLTSRRCILNTYSTNIRNEYFKRAA